MVSVAAESREDHRVTTASRKRQQAPMKDVELERGEPSPVTLDLMNDDVSLTGEDAEDSAEPLHIVEQSGDFVGDEEESGALGQARKEAELTLSVDSVRAYLKQIGKIALLTAEQEVELAKRIEAGLYAAELLHRAEDATEKLSPQLHRELRLIVRDGERAKRCR
jgi:RNA polymerase primary sigma factor